MHQWVQQKELNNKNEQSVVIIILVATLFVIKYSPVMSKIAGIGIALSRAYAMIVLLKQ